MTLSLIRRRDAAQTTLDRFKGHPFAWGRYDCVRLVAFHLRQLGKRPGLGRAGSYKSALGARRALQRAGYVDLAAALDWLGLHRIAPASALTGDVLMVPGDGEFDALMVAVNNGRAIGYHQDTIGTEVLQPLNVLSAWRV